MRLLAYLLVLTLVCFSASAALAAQSQDWALAEADPLLPVEAEGESDRPPSGDSLPPATHRLYCPDRAKSVHGPLPILVPTLITGTPLCIALRALLR